MIIPFLKNAIFKAWVFVSLRFIKNVNYDFGEAVGISIFMYVFGWF